MLKSTFRALLTENLSNTQDKVERMEFLFSYLAKISDSPNLFEDISSSIMEDVRELAMQSSDYFDAENEDEISGFPLNLLKYIINVARWVKPSCHFL